MAHSLRQILIYSALEAASPFGPADERQRAEEIYEVFARKWAMNMASEPTQSASATSGSFFFLFWKNLSVTNITVPELMSLIQRHTVVRADNNGENKKVDFLTSREYKDFFINIWLSLTESVFRDNPVDWDQISLRSKIYLTSAAKDQSEADVIDAMKYFSDEKCKLENNFTKIAEHIVRFHADFFDRTIIFDYYFTSALIHIPISLAVDIRLITFEAGYILSSGACIYARNIDKAKTGEFRIKLKAFLEINRTKNFYITPFASELFSQDEVSKSSASVRNGLDGVIIQLRKHYFDRIPLLVFLNELKDEYGDRIIIPSGNQSFLEERRRAKACDAAASAAAADPECTIWFITDSGVGYDRNNLVVNRNKEIFIFVYAQLYRNSNQLVIFKERKPAWVSSTTLPHTLSGAMVNIAIANLPEDRRESPLVMDPFCGTGTVLFDAAIRIPSAKIVGLDRLISMPLLIKHNLNLLTLEKADVYDFTETLRYIRDDLTRIVDNKDEVSSFQGSVVTAASTSNPLDKFKFAFRLLIEELSTGAGDFSSISDASVSAKNRCDFSRALLDTLWRGEIHSSFQVITLFFMIWRALLTNTFSLRKQAWNARGILRLIRDEISRSYKEYSDLNLGYDRPMRVSSGALDNAIFCERIGNYAIEGMLRIDAFEGQYKSISSQTIGSFARDEDCFDEIVKNIPNLKCGINIYSVINSLSFLKKCNRQLDIIITDPPYGFNTLNDNWEVMAGFYAELASALVGALRSHGQLIIALPAYAKNGQQIPYYQTKDSFIKQIVYGAENSGRSIINFSSHMRGSREMFDLPWYWGPKNIIERRILHFVVR